MSVVVAAVAKSPQRWTLVGLLAVLAASLFAFGHIAEDYLTNDPLVDWDVRFALWLHDHSSGGLVSFFRVVTNAGNTIVLLVLAAAVVTLFARAGRTHAAATLILALGGAAILNGLLKLLFHRSRPEVAFVHLATYSFPSGHAAVTTATFTTLAFLIGRRSTRRRSAAMGAAAVGLIALVDFSRLYLGAHYLSDVLAGTSFGLSWACVCLIGYTLWSDRRLRREGRRELGG